MIFVNARVCKKMENNQKVSKFAQIDSLF